MSQNNTISGSARRNSSPELWIPYVLIGVSCVTFLAVHFWCYHKRNRERYLRKRDETRVKCGLLERRRITTLMLAKYQSDLGIIRKEKSVDLTRLFYDNSVDVIFDKYDYYRNISVNKHRAIHSSTVEAKHKEPVLSTSTAPDDPGTLTTTTKAIASSQTWPLVAQRKNTPYNAHRRSSKEDPDSESVSATKTVALTDNCDNDKVIYTSAAEDKPQSKIIRDVCIPQGEAKTVRCNVNSPQTPPAPLSSPEQDNAAQASVHRVSSPATSYPRIFYTSLISSPSTQSSFFSAFIPKHKKRRYYSSPVEDVTNDPFGTNQNIVTKPGEFSRLYDADTTCSAPDTVYISGRNSQGIVLENCEKPCYRKLESTAQGFSADEALPIAEGGQEYGSISYNSENEQAQMIPLYNHGRNHSHGICDQRAVNNSCYTSHENPVCSLQSDKMENVNITTNMNVQSAIVSNTDNTSSSRNRVYQQNVVIPFPEKSYLNIVSKNPGKTRKNARANDSAHVSWSRPRPGKMAKRNTIDSHIHSHSPKLHASNSRSHDAKLPPESVPLFHLSDLASTESVSSGFSLVKDVPENTESCVDYVDRSDLKTPNNNDTISITQDTSTVCNVIPKTPALRSLDRCLLIQNTKRKLGVNSE